MFSMRRSLLASIAGLMALAGTAQGLVETSAITAYEIRLPDGDYDLYQRQTTATRDASRTTEAQLIAAHGGAWRVPAWNPLTDTPHYVLGSGFETGVRLLDDATAESVARTEIGAHPEVFRSISMSDLDLSDVRRGAGKVAVHFQQTHGGVPIIGGRAHLTFTESGRLFVMKSDLYGNINLSTTPSVSREAATAIAIADLPVDRGTDALDGDVELRVLPVPSGAGVRHHLVWVARVETSEPVGIWVSHVDAHTGEIIYRYNDVHFLEYGGTAESDVQENTYCNGVTADDPLAYVRVAVSGLPLVDTDANGDWNAGEGGTGPRNVTSLLIGPYVDINNSSGADAQINGVVTGGVPFTVDYNDSNSRQDERDVFSAVGDIHDFFEQFDPGYVYSNNQIVANVAIGLTCNAFWNGTINFYVEGGGCANTGEIQGVVHHEFGHGVQNNLIGGQGSQGLGEGNSDVLANLITQEAEIGRGFNLGNCVTGIRTSDNNLQYPGDLQGESHADGRIIAGFHWDVLQGMQASYGTENGTLEAASVWHYGRKLEQPSNQPDQVLATYIADDDDGDLGNGTPNCIVIDNAATNHGYEQLCGLVVAHDTIDSRTTSGDVQTDATITSLVSSITGASLFYNVVNATARGGFVEVPMTDDDVDDVYEATIPGLVDLDQVAYYIVADAADGSQQTNPQGAPASVYKFDIATIFQDQESDQGWTVDAEGIDTATTGMWERVDPNGTAAQPEDDHTTVGTLCWVTQQHPLGGGLGDTDVDNGSTRLYSPVYNLSGSTTAIAKYWRWYTNNTGAEPNADLWVVEARNNGGPWTTIESTNASAGEWVQIEADLVSLFGVVGSVELRFHASDLAGGSLVEAGVDDFAILSDDAKVIAVGDGPSGAPRASYLADARPNPFNPQTTFRFGLAEAGDVRIEIYDVSGRMVRALVDAPIEAGHYQVTWDGTGSAGKSLSSGVYYARMTSQGRVVQQQKMTLLK